MILCNAASLAIFLFRKTFWPFIQKLNHRFWLPMKRKNTRVMFSISMWYVSIRNYSWALKHNRLPYILRHQVSDNTCDNRSNLTITWNWQRLTSGWNIPELNYVNVLLCKHKVGLVGSKKLAQSNQMFKTFSSADCTKYNVGLQHSW